MAKIKVIDGFQLKIIMAVLMLMDHLHYSLPGFPYWFHVVSRVVAPVFAYLVAEGLYYTSNRAEYLKRMFTIGGVMLAVDIALLLVLGRSPGNSIIMALGLSATMVCCIDKAIAKEGSAAKWIFFAVLLFGICIFFEGMMLCPLMLIIFYYLRKKPLTMWIVFILVSVLMLFAIGMLFDAQIYMVFSFIPILFYNGKRGVSGKFAKYFFYVFYPVHIWIIFLIKELIF